MKNQEDVLKCIENGIVNYNDDNEVFDKLYEKVKLRINLEKLTKIWSGTYQIGMLYDREQYYIINALYEITKSQEFDVNKYFYEPEIEEYNLAPIAITTNENSWTLHNVDKIDDHTFTCHDTIENLTKGADNNFLTYNTKTQRRPKIRKTKGGNVIELPDIKPAATRDIMKEFENGTHPQNQITLNIRYINGMELKNVAYDSRKRTLTFPQDLFIDIIDGAHRCQGATMAVHKIKNNPEKEFALKKQLNIQIEHLDVQQALQLIKKTAKSNPLDEEFLASIDEKDIGLDMAREINTQQPAQRNSMFEKIGDFEEEVKFNKKYCYVRTLSEAINYNFGDILLKTDDFRESKLVRSHIVNVINEILGYHKKEISEGIIKSREQNMLLMDKAFIGYVALAKATYNVEGWDMIIDNILDNLDITWKNPQWGKKNLKLQSKARADISFVKVISSYFENLVINEIKKEGVM